MDKMENKNALLSVSDKRGLDDLAAALTRHGWQLWASGGTGKWLGDKGFVVRSSSELTGFADLLGGRVKTLDSKIHAGILARSREDAQALQELNIPQFGLVVVNLYPFAEEAEQASPAEAVELIDIGGPALLRAAAKNCRYSTPLASPDWYGEAIAALDDNAGTIPAGLAQDLAARTFALTSAYDSAIARWHQQNLAAKTPHPAPPSLPEQLVLPPQEARSLHYGENPHQTARLYRFLGTGGTAHAELLHPADGVLSYNNHADLEAAWQMVTSFAPTVPAVAVIKHTTPCGVAVARDQAVRHATLLQSALDAGGADSYGGIVATNFAPQTESEIDAFATVLKKHFLELLAVPEAPNQRALAQCLEASGKTRRLVAVPPLQTSGLQLRSLSGGVLAQTLPDDSPLALEDCAQTEWQQVSGGQASQETLLALAFAWRVAGKALSNAIVAAQWQSHGTSTYLRTLRIAGGQTSRVAACQQVAAALRDLGKQKNTDSPIVAASDGFFPFADGLETLAEAGVEAVIAPSGSKRDGEVAAAAERLNLALFLSPRRGFRH